MNRSEESTCNARADHTENNREALFIYLFFSESIKVWTTVELIVCHWNMSQRT